MMVMKFKNNNYKKIKKEVFKQRIQDFYRPFTELFEEADVYRPEGKDFVYQMTGLQCLLTFVFMVLWLVGLQLLSYNRFIGYHIVVPTMMLTLPYVIEGPRYLLPWRLVPKHELYAVRWKSKWGVTLSLLFGFFVGWALSISLSSYL